MSVGCLCVWGLACLDWQHAAAVANKRFVPLHNLAQSADANPSGAADGCGYFPGETDDVEASMQSTHSLAAQIDNADADADADADASQNRQV